MPESLSIEYNQVVLSLRVCWANCHRWCSTGKATWVFGRGRGETNTVADLGVNQSTDFSLQADCRVIADWQTICRERSYQRSILISWPTGRVNPIVTFKACLVVKSLPLQLTFSLSIFGAQLPLIDKKASLTTYHHVRARSLQRDLHRCCLHEKQTAHSPA